MKAVLIGKAMTYCMIVCKGWELISSTHLKIPKEIRCPQGRSVSSGESPERFKDMSLWGGDKEGTHGVLGIHWEFHGGP